MSSIEAEPIGGSAAAVVNEELLENKIKAGILQAGSECEFVKAIDISGCGCGLKFELTIVSEYNLRFLQLLFIFHFSVMIFVILFILSCYRIFGGKPLLAQHRLVHKIIEEERKEIHALTLKTLTPGAWKTQQGAVDKTGVEEGAEQQNT
jgi:acid stress-induced BolA-like protein IbaG/YrbA